MIRPVPELGGYTCDCGRLVWRAKSPEHYAEPELLLEERAGGAWIMADDGTWQAARVGLDHGDLKIHRCDDEPALGDVVDLHHQP